MNVLVSNDDGINAMGIRVLIEALSEIEGVNIYVSAPDNEMSACSHKITLGSPIMLYNRVVENAKGAWSTSGTPADCVKFGLEILKTEYDIDIDVVFSGINHGGNIGTDVLYSGTLAAALEGVINHVPAVAISVDNFRPTEQVLLGCKELIKEICTKIVPTLDNTTCLNVNYPAIPHEKIKGLKVTRLGPREYVNEFDIRENPWGLKYSWYGGSPVIYKDLPDDYDIVAHQEGYITVTPIHIDFTYYEEIERLRQFDLKF